VDSAEKPLTSQSSPQRDIADEAEPPVPVSELFLDWPRRLRKRDDSREVLQHFRDEYYVAMRDVAPDHASCMQNSHIQEALEIGIWQPMLRDDIGLKLHEYVFGPTDPDELHPFVHMAEQVSKGAWIQDRIGREKLQACGPYI
jgi:hypothetical protein